MLKRFDHVSVEHVCFGYRNSRTYRFLRDVEHMPEDTGTARIIDSAANPSVPIIGKALDGDHPSKGPDSGPLASACKPANQRTQSRPANNVSGRVLAFSAATDCISAGDKRVSYIVNHNVAQLDGQVGGACISSGGRSRNQMATVVPLGATVVLPTRRFVSSVAYVLIR